MASSEDENIPHKGTQNTGPGKAKDPEWAGGLKKLYNSVVDEPLPDSFTNLLSQLDKDEGK
ncbi:MAG: NepR family anti-sigma factor [Alteraurantiacibacter sp.]